MDKFRNINYPYANQDDTFNARGLHLNMLVDEINTIRNEIDVPTILAAGTTDVVLGPSEDIDAMFIDYKAKFPATPIGVRYDEVGQIVINNSMNHPIDPQLHHSREVTNHTSGSLTNVEINVVLVGLDLILRITNGTIYTMQFILTSKTMKYVS